VAPDALNAIEDVSTDAHGGFHGMTSDARDGSNPSSWTAP
jgi:hypothetical protein